MNQTVWEAFLITLFLIRTARVLWYLLFLWQLKEYRFDRMRIHLRTDQGKKLYFLPYRGLKISPKTILFCIMTFISELLIYFALPFHPLWRLFILDLLSFPLIGLFVFIVSIPQYFYHQWIIGKATEKIRAHKNLFVIGITGSYGPVARLVSKGAVPFQGGRLVRQLQQRRIVGVCREYLVPPGLQLVRGNAR